MAPILVVGATGQLGTAAIDRLVGMGRIVRALVRPGSPSLAAACRGVATVLATANVVVPLRLIGAEEFLRAEAALPSPDWPR